MENFIFCAVVVSSKIYTQKNKKHRFILMFLFLVTKKKSLRKKCPDSEFFRFVISCIWTEYQDLLIKSLYSVRMWENTDEKISEFARFSRSECVNLFALFQRFTLVGSNSGVQRRAMRKRTTGAAFSYQPISYYGFLSISSQDIRKLEVLQFFQGVLNQVSGMKWLMQT